MARKLRWKGKTPKKKVDNKSNLKLELCVNCLPDEIRKEMKLVVVCGDWNAVQGTEMELLQLFQ